MAEIKVNFNHKLRKMKPMHGVNNGPRTCNFSRDTSPLFKEAGLPVSRLHDTEYPFGSGEFVDVHCVFKNFNADENDPENYNFTLTDLYLKSILDCGTKIIYRLGCSIEHNPVKVHVWPPKDFAKWARICEHIIRHYNEGWANGYNWNIRYWEIWNEPNVSGQKEWGGTPEQFAEFYTVAATHLKKCFPDLMIGGPAFTGPDGPFIQTFFAEITKNGNHPPMDFYSWHGYMHRVENAMMRAELAYNVMKTYGYEDAESIYDEWNYVYTWENVVQAYQIMNSTKGMAFDAAVMAAMQSSKCTCMCYYDAQMKFEGGWCALFKSRWEKQRNGAATNAVPKKPFYSFKAFNEVYRLGAKETEGEIGAQHETIADQVEMEISGEQLYGVASRSYDGTKGAILLANYADIDQEPITHELTVSLTDCPKATGKLYLLDETHDLEEFGTVSGETVNVTLPSDSVILLLFE